MSDEPRWGSSIRTRLLIFIISSLLLMVAGGALVTYWVALHTVTDAYDRSLLDPVFDIADNVRIEAGTPRVDLPSKALDALVYDKVDKVMFQIRSPDNKIIDGAVDLPPPPPMSAGEHMFFDGAYGGEPIRVAALRTATGFVVQVGETLHKRNRLVAEFLVAELVPSLLIALAAIALAWFGVAHGLKPLESLRSELLGRAPRDLRPLSAASASVEIAPLLRAFNELLARLRDANTMQQRFLANAAHQLRTPLAGLQMHLELLLRRELGDDVRAEIERMHTATVRASRLANQLLALAKAEGPADRRSDLRVVDLKSFADSAARDWAPRALARKIDLGFSLEHAPIHGDPLLLPELIDNLIDNALRYTPSGGAVTVNTGSETTTSYLTVEDTGPGIPAGERNRVRERFYRVAGTPGDGSGLGLAIAQEVVDRHAGVLEIASRNGSGGTRVRVSFPRSNSAEV
ncbi:MAG: sensor histidine kinase [Betaproteobacteria bacterium]|nr:MAG: sensor histidine kinase [Betaproteobacteria bacterium]